MAQFDILDITPSYQQGSLASVSKVVRILVQDLTNTYTYTFLAPFGAELTVTFICHNVKDPYDTKIIEVGKLDFDEVYELFGAITFIALARNSLINLHCSYYAEFIRKHNIRTLIEEEYLI